MDEIQEFIRSLRYHRLTSGQRKTLRGQALAGDLVGAKKGLQQLYSAAANRKVHCSSK